MPINITVLISGNGTNLQALIDACSNQSIPHAQIVHVISNRKDAYGLTRANAAGIPISYHNLVKYKKEYQDLDVGKVREIYDNDLAYMVLARTTDIVVCAGFMHVLAPSFLQPLKAAGVPVINLHPALPGQFNGINAIQRAYEAFQRQQITKTGVMVHYVIAEVDMGEPILVREIELRSEESFQDLESRIHTVERQVIIEATKLAINRLQQKKRDESP